MFCIWVKINDSRGTYNTNGQIKSKTSMLKSNLCDYSDEYIPLKGTISVANMTVATANAYNENEKVIFRNCVAFTD